MRTHDPAVAVAKLCVAAVTDCEGDGEMVEADEEEGAAETSGGHGNSERQVLPCLQVVQPLYSVRARLTVPPLPHRERAQAKKEEAAREKQAREEQAAATGDLSLLDMLG